MVREAAGPASWDVQWDSRGGTAREGQQARGQSFVNAGSSWLSDPASQRCCLANWGRDGATELARISCSEFVIFGWSFRAPSPLVALSTVVYWS